MSKGECNPNFKEIAKINVKTHQEEINDNDDALITDIAKNQEPKEYKNRKVLSIVVCPGGGSWYTRLFGSWWPNYGCYWPEHETEKSHRRIEERLSSQSFVVSGNFFVQLFANLLIQMVGL